ncbi:sulfate ABC transporter permease subunit CysW [Alcanivorax sp. JB21]|uniref:sulfate ABC transporter permease subunit CysW n=1 Tax=Alcanivorax limicola TaxID=2874102 RepID=UPI001CBCD370|nr:sulfate ABC transporter permease subunit CysW [Alcanivorax limicola]MBZ2188639.1 sulfate ABC transporter permease subunit CysW [Alcanivorax limicola]
MQTPRSLLQWSLVLLALALTVLLLVLPLVLIFSKALGAGWEMVALNLADSDMRHAIWLTVLAALITVPVNLVFGVLLAWCVTRYEFRGRKFLTTLIDIPFAMSPVVAGLCYLVIYGIESRLGGWLYDHDIQLMFAWPGIVMVTIFVTCPYVARVLIPLMESQGSDEEEAALLLGASGFKTFLYVTLPNIKWALLYGVVITNARAVGEFGAVSVVSGSIRGQTLTLPLHVELLHQDYNTVGAFTAAALLASMAMLTLVLKTIMEWRQQQRITNGNVDHENVEKEAQPQ